MSRSTGQPHWSLVEIIQEFDETISFRIIKYLHALYYDHNSIPSIFMITYTIHLLRLPYGITHIYKHVIWMAKV